MRRAFARHVDLALAAAVAILFAAPLFATSDWFWGSGTDLPRMELPFHDFAMRWLSRGVLPFWNPFVFGGVPFQGGLHGLLYPGWWTGIVLPLGLDVKLGILLHLVIAAVGGAWFARVHVRHRVAAALAGVTVGLSAFPILHLFAGHRVLMATAAWLPWLAGALDRVRRDGARRLPLAVLLAGIAVLCGNYQMVFIGMGGLLAYGTLDAALAPGVASAVERGRSAARAAAAWLVALAGGAALGAVQLLPMLGTLARSQRAAGGAAFASIHSTPPGMLLTYVLPDLFGNHLDLPYVASGSLWEASGYLGLVPLVLVAAAPLLLPWRRWLAPALVMGLAALLSLGSHTPLFDVYLAAVPGASLFRVPGRFCLLVGLFGALLAARVLDAWLDAEPARARRAAVPAALLALALGAAAFALTPGSGLADALGSLADPARLAALPGAARDAWADGFRQAGRAAAVATGAAALLTLGPAAERRRRLAAAGALLALHVLDLHAFARPFLLRTAPPALFDWPTGVTDVVRAAGDPAVRVVPPLGRTWYDYGVRHDVGSPAGYDTFIESRWARYLNRSQGRPLDHYFSLEPLRRGGALVRHLGVRFLLLERRPGSVAPVGYEGFEPIARAGRVAIQRASDPVPRAALAHAARVVEDEIETYRRMEAPTFDVRRLALLEAPLPAGAPVPRPPPPGASESVHIVRYEPNRVAIEVEAASPGLLVLSDVWSPGWRATVDAAPAPLVPANRVMRAVPVPAGRHAVEMRYRPPGFLAGAALSALALGALAWSGRAARRRARSPARAAADPPASSS